MYSRLTYLVAPILINTVHASGNVCYMKGGQQTSSQNNYTPCFPSDPQTHCCDSDWTCLSNGLCLVKWDTSVNTGACTDPTWSDSSCFQSCPDFSTLYRCSDNNWCCSSGGNTTSCCNDPGVSTFTISAQAEIQNGTAFIPGYNIAANSDISTSTPQASGSATTQTVTSSSPSNSASDTQSGSQAQASSSDTGAMAAGLGAGLGVGIPLLLAVGALSYLLFRERKNNKALKQQLGIAATGPAPAYGAHPADPSARRQEMNGYSKPPALPNHMNELPDRGTATYASELQS